jgi:hypothetical protein
MGPKGLAPAFGYIYQTWTLERGEKILRDEGTWFSAGWLEQIVFIITILN